MSVLFLRFYLFGHRSTYIICFAVDMRRNNWSIRLAGKIESFLSHFLARNASIIER